MQKYKSSDTESSVQQYMREAITVPMFIEWRWQKQQQTKTELMRIKGTQREKKNGSCERKKTNKQQRNISDFEYYAYHASHTHTQHRGEKKI